MLYDPLDVGRPCFVLQKLVLDFSQRSTRHPDKKSVIARKNSTNCITHKQKNDLPMRNF